jgi:hypothetical protein
MPRLDTLRLFDLGIINWLRDPQYGITVNQKPIPVILATPERAFSEMADLINKGWSSVYPDMGLELTANQISAESLRSDASLVPLPFISVARMDMVYRPEHRNTNSWRKVTTSQQPPIYLGDHDAVLASEYPRPYNIFYQVDIWARYRQDANNIVQQILQWGNPELSLWIDFKVPWGKQLFDIFITEVVDNSDLEAGDAQSWKRHTVRMYYEAYMLEAFIDVADIPSYDQLIQGGTSPYRLTVTKPTVKQFDVNILNPVTGTETEVITVTSSKTTVS